MSSKERITGSGVIKRLVDPYLFREDGTPIPASDRKIVAEIMKDTDLLRRQVTGRIASLRGSGTLPHPTDEDTHTHKSRAQKGHRSYGTVPPPFTGPHSVETRLRFRKARSGKEVSQANIDRIALSVKARQVIRDRSLPTLSMFYQKSGKAPPPPGRSKEMFLEIVYAAEVCSKEERQEDQRPFFDQGEVERVYKKADSQAFQRWEEDIKFIKDHMQDSFAAGQSAAGEVTIVTGEQLEEEVVKQEVNEEQRDPLELAAEISLALGDPNITELYASRGRNLPEDPQYRQAVAMIYALRLSNKFNQSTYRDRQVPKEALEAVQGYVAAMDDSMVQALRDEIAFLRDNANVSAS